MKTTIKSIDPIELYSFASSSAAWSFMHACDAAKIHAGYPSLDEKNTVQVAVPSARVRETAERLAKEAVS